MESRWLSNKWSCGRLAAVVVAGLLGLVLNSCGGRVTLSETVEVEMEMKAPVEKVFSYMADPSHAPPSASHIQGSGLGQTNDWKFEMAGKVISGHALCTDWLPNQRKVFATWGDIDGSETYLFLPTPHGAKVVVIGSYFIQAPAATPDSLKQAAMGKIRDFWKAYLLRIKEGVEGSASVSP